ncbi:MAG: hypothetical protein ACYSUI_12555 [Planctomycetota bacterium]
MSEIPSDIAGSALQAGFQSRNVGKARDSERAGQAHAANTAARAADEAGSTVETTDSDTQVYADAEGTGSKGRPFEEELLEETSADQDEETEDDGLSISNDGQVHLDIEA